MLFRLFVKVLRFIVILIIIALLLFCILFALLQSRWVKEQMREKITGYLKEVGIAATLVELNGQLPLTWSIEKADLQLGEHHRLTLSGIKFRFAILPLIKGEVAVSYLNIEEGEYVSRIDSAPMLATHTPSIAIKKGVRDALERFQLPCPVRIEHFSIDTMHIGALRFAGEGNASINPHVQAFALDLKILSPDQNRTSLELLCKGSKASDSIAAEWKIHLDPLPSFLCLGVEGSVVAECNVSGPWNTWHAFLYALPCSGAPITCAVKAAAKHMHIADYPILNRDWTFETHLSFAPQETLSIPMCHLTSDLVHMQAQAQLHSDLKTSTATLSLTLPDLSLCSSLAPFPLSGSALAKGCFQEGRFQASIETQTLLLGTFEAGAAAGSLEGGVEGEKWSAEVHLASRDAAIPFEGSFSLGYAPSTLLSCTDLHFDAPNLSLSGSLQYNLADALYDGSLIAHVSHLNQLGTYFNQETLNGSFDAEVTLVSRENAQNVTCALFAKNLRYQDILLDDLNCSAQIHNLFTTPQGRCNVLAQKIYTPSFYIDRLNFGTHSDAMHCPFYIDCKGRVESPFECYSEGFWQQDKTLFTLELTQFIGELSDTPFALRSPCQLQWGEHFLNLSPFDLHIGTGHFFSTFALSPNQSLGQWELKHFPLEILSCLRPRFGLSGFVTTSGFIDAKPGTLQGALNAVIEEAGVLHYGKKDPLQAKGSCQIHLSQNRAQVHANLNAIDQQFLDFSATLPLACTLYPFKMDVDPTQNASAELVAEGRLQDLFDFVNLGTNHFTGLLSCRLFLSQTLGAPFLQGQLQLQNGSYENYFTGINLRHIDAQFEAHNDQMHLVSLHAEDDAHGEVVATGKIDLQPKKQFPYAFIAEMARLHAVNFDMIDCTLTGPVYLTGDLHTLFAQGNLLIDTATVHIAQRLPYEVSSLPVTYINRPPRLLSKSVSNSPGFAFHIDLELTSEGHVLATGRGLNAELEGNIHLHGTNTDIAASGALKLITGEYLFSGKVFKLTEGEILFNDKPSPSAHLNISGTLSLPDITITVMMRGPLSSPQLTFLSNPQKPTSSILARILFNKDITEISHPEAIQLASTLVSLSGGAGPDVLESIRSSIGVDRLNISSTPDSDQLAVQIGKYLTRGILITLSQSATSSQVIVEVELPKGFVFQAETQEQEEGKFSLKWRRSY